MSPVVEAKMDSGFASRCVGAFVGLALGDAYGRPVEFVPYPDVRTYPIDLDQLMWTDDTHMALYLAEVVRDLPGWDADAFGTAWGEALVRWAHDPLTPSTAPGSTCLAGARHYEQHRDWRTSGVAESDGCGAPMRIAPLPMRWRGDTLRHAARVSSVLTHGHPNAVAATEALCELLGHLLDGEPLSAAISAARALLIRAEHPPLTLAALDAAVAWAPRGQRWLDEAAIPAGDGGWRSSSAVGLAVAAALRWEDTAEMLDKAARIDGDSDSVAAIAGMLRGAERPDSLPDWSIPERDRIEALARTLAALA